MKNMKIINPPNLVKAMLDCNSGQFGNLSSSDFELMFEEVEPIIGYEKSTNQETGEVFPKCCNWHRSINKLAIEWYDDFPNCCEQHKKLIGQSWYNKDNYQEVVVKIINQLSFTEHCIIENIEKDDWYSAITEYIHWNYSSFGQLPKGYGSPVGLDKYLGVVIKYIQISTNKIPKEKGLQLIKFIENYYNPSKNQQTDLNILLNIYKKWLSIFPFELSYFKNLKLHFETQYPFINGKPEVNRYTGLATVIAHTKESLVDILINLTNNLLTQINSLALYEKGLLTNPQKVNLELILNERSLKLKQGYVNTSQNEEQKFRNILKEWFRDEKQFINEITPLLKETELKLTYKTEKKSRIEKVKDETIIDWWANGECAQMLYNREYNTYQLIRLNKDNNQLWEVSPMNRDTTNCPIIAKGIIAFVISNLGNSEKVIFNKYYDRSIAEYKNIEEAKPGSSMRDLVKEFYPLHFDDEHVSIDFSQQIAPYLDVNEMSLLNQFAQSYLSYIETSYNGNIEVAREKSALSVSDWSIVFYYLYATGVFEGSKIKEIEKFIGVNNILNPAGKRTTTTSFKKAELENKNRINGKLNKHGEVEWSDKYPPLPHERIEKILPFIKKNKKALQTAKNDIERLPIETEEYKAKRLYI